MTPVVKKKATKKVIDSAADYKATMKQIEVLMSKGSTNVSASELATIRKLALMAQDYEQRTYPVPAPTTFAGILEMRMYELKLRQTQLAKKLHVSDTKLSLIMSGKQRPDVAFLKSVHTVLNIDANILLKAV